MTAGSGQTAFFDKTYNETLVLLHEARAFSAKGLHFRAAAEPMAALRIHSELLRITARLTQVMAWLLHRKAVFAGEISRLEAAADPKARIGARSVCQDYSGHSHPDLPLPLRDLLHRSHALYMRVTRLDELVQRDAAPNTKFHR